MPSSIMHLVLCTLTVYFLTASHALPVVFPSFTTTGFAKIGDVDELVTIPEAFTHLLCKTSGESVDFEPANKTCSRIIFFTSKSSLTLNFLNISSDYGVAQPLAMTPQIKSSEETLNLFWSIPDLHDDGNTSNRSESETSASTEGKNDSQCGERLKDVEAADNTSSFLGSSCTVRPEFGFVVELYLARLPEQQFIALEFGFEENVTRSLMIYVDSSPVLVDIQQNRASKNDLNGDKAPYELNLTFSTVIVGRPSEGDFSCTEVTGPLNSLISAAKSEEGRHRLTPYHLLAVVNASIPPVTCPQPLRNLEEALTVTVNNVNANLTPGKTDFDVCQQLNGEASWQTVITAKFSIERGKTRNVSVIVSGEGVVSLTGTPVEPANKTLNISNEPVSVPQPAPPFIRVSPPGGGSPPPSQRVTLTSTSEPHSSMSDEDSVAAMRMLGKTMSGLTLGTLGLSFIASIGMPFLTFVAPSDAPALMSELGCLSSVVNLIHLGQRVYLMTKLAVPNLPESFKAFGEQFGWTMLNFKAPWVTRAPSDDESDTAHSGRRSLLGNDTATEDVDIEDDPYSKLRDTYFWTGIALVSLGFLHCVLIAIFIRYRDSVPSILRLPRLELYLVQSCIAIVAQGPAYLFTGTTRQIIIGVLVLTVGIIPLACWHYHVIHKYLFDEGREEKRIVYTLSSVDVSEPAVYPVYTPEISDDSTTDELSGVISLRRIPRENIQKEGDQSWFSTHIVSVLLGPLYRSGRWTFRDGYAVRVIDRYGPVFEDYRGKPMHETKAQQGNATETDDPSRDFEPVGAENRYPIDVPEYSFFLRISEKVISLGTMVFTTLLILGEDDPESNYQAALLIGIQVAYVAYLRTFRPHCSRWNLGVAMFEKSLDALSLFLLVWKLNIGHSTSRNNIGVTMAILESVAIGMQLIDILLTILPMLKKAREAFGSGESVDRTASLTVLFMRHPDMEIGFEEMLFHNPREAIAVKIIQPITTSLHGARRRKRDKSGTDSNHSRESVHNGSAALNLTEAEQTKE